MVNLLSDSMDDIHYQIAKLHPRLTPQENITCILMYDLCDNTGFCSLSNRQVAKHLGLPKRIFIKRLKRLKKFGLIKGGA